MGTFANASALFPVVTHEVEMPSPFPGMDPYLENPDLWPSFHHDFVTGLRQILLPGLIDPYTIHVRERHYTAQEEHREAYLEIVSGHDERLVTLLDVVSPSNKTTAAGREAYLSVWQQAKAAGASAVELDLVLQGQPMLDYSREGLPAWDYAVTVSRATPSEWYEIYVTTLRKRLPRFKVPLDADHHDAVLDLPAAFDRCYDRAEFGRRIDYEQPPTVLHDRIAMTAFEIWQEEGCPHGRDQEHWYRAVEQVIGPVRRA